MLDRRSLALAGFVGGGKSGHVHFLGDMGGAAGLAFLGDSGWWLVRP